MVQVLHQVHPWPLRKKQLLSKCHAHLSAQTCTIVAYISQPSTNVNPCVFDERGVKYPKKVTKKHLQLYNRIPPQLDKHRFIESVYIHYISYVAIRCVCVWKNLPAPKSPSWQVVGKFRESPSSQDSHGTFTPRRNGGWETTFLWAIGGGLMSGAMVVAGMFARWSDCPVPW